MPRQPLAPPGLRRDRFHWLRRIADLDPETDFHEIYRISAGYEFPWDYTRALELALYRTYCVPSISALLDATGEFGRSGQKRYDDTSLLMGEMVEHGVDSDRGRASLRTVNRMHNRYAISNGDMLYVLSTFVFEPIDWIADYGWRPLTGAEREAALRYYTEVGRRMNIRDIPADLDSFREFRTAYERDHFRYTETNARVGRATLDVFRAWFPAPLRPAADAGLRALLDEPMLEAFGFAPAPRWLGRAVRTALRVRAGVVAQLPPRRVSRLSADRRNRTYPGYPDGYAVEDMGAPEPTGIDAKWLRAPTGPA
ncbi:oxygenase MpaB family protein [Streptomonospora wellingtoniae]|uniref:Oxygenase MpaB family protein n=1 Tax=Streptomonospora wellingtoniae TaxID=3075544 RepID=A0ABU2KXN5_9ACTN|nr:oxygenase MpaB family protein [Streptomonospora sp. DSM 45055]MDT0304059.1 oxygenase MpaB family protein [Streptomonospora sp. DSM 45055]